MYLRHLGYLLLVLLVRDARHDAFDPGRRHYPHEGVRDGGRLASFITRYHRGDPRSEGFVPLTNKILAALHGRAAQMQESQRFLGFLAPNKHACLSISFIHFFDPINGMHASSTSAVGLRPPFLPSLCSLVRSHPESRGATLPSMDVLSISRDTAEQACVFVH